MITATASSRLLLIKLGRKEAPQRCQYAPALGHRSRFRGTPVTSPYLSAVVTQLPALCRLQQSVAAFGLDMRLPHPG